MSEWELLGAGCWMLDARSSKLIARSSKLPPPIKELLPQLLLIKQIETKPLLHKFSHKPDRGNHVVMEETVGFVEGDDLAEIRHQLFQFWG